MKFVFITVFVALYLLSCKNEPLPKPASYLRLDYPVARYQPVKSSCPFAFEANTTAIIKNENNCGIAIQYPKMKATIYITYKSVNQNIKTLLRDAQKLTYEHVIKADEILEQPFFNKDKKVYGLFYSVNGNAATNSQFYVTDSTTHFITGSMYFYAKPNYDSIMPAASYVKNDMQRLMETIVWK